MKRFIIIVTLLTLNCALCTVNSQSYTPYSSTITEVGAGGVSEYTYYGYQSSSDYYYSTGYRAGSSGPGPNRAGIIDDEDDDGEGGDVRPGSQTDPLPIGNGMWVLLLLAAAYGFVRSRGVGSRGVGSRGREAERKRGK